MKLFELQTKLTSYTYPLIKITFSLLIILLSIFHDEFFTISIAVLNFMATLLCLIATIASILCIYISVGELFYVRENRKAKK